MNQLTLKQADQLLKRLIYDGSYVALLQRV